MRKISAMVSVITLLDQGGFSWVIRPGGSAYWHPNRDFGGAAHFRIDYGEHRGGQKQRRPQLPTLIPGATAEADHWDRRGSKYDSAPVQVVSAPALRVVD